MEPIDKKNINAEEQLSQLLGSYKAEWLREKIYDLFTEPAYFPELKTSRPCVLIGARGTGKTTVLRCLSYEGQFALSGSKPESITDWSYYGIYYRVNTNRVTAFKGHELTEEQWIRLFAHYLNLLICDQILRFLDWYQRHLPGATQLNEIVCTRVANSLNLPNAQNTNDLANQINSLFIDFEAYINNVGNRAPILLSSQGAPIDTLCDVISQLPQFKDKIIFFLLDEYENFEDYQQQVVNTLIKHSGQLYTFKIGVRELGMRCRTTLNKNEKLIHPADYVRINITEKLNEINFKEFAKAVCNARISKLHLEDGIEIKDISKMLPNLSEDDEAKELGVSDYTTEIKRELSDNPRLSEYLRETDNMTPLELYFIKFWSESYSEPFDITFKDFLSNRSEWNTRYQNYKHALLYTLKRRKRGIRKYYAGWDVFIKLSANNIRYLLELVEQSLVLYLQNEGDLSKPVPYDIQTIAAQNSGKKNLSELEGLSVDGAKLTKLLLGLGRIFQVMATDLSGHSPEVNQFYLDDQIIGGNEAEVEKLLSSAVMHLALLRFTGNKLMDEAETRDYDYMVHPIFTPFFVFSYRKKRKMKLTGNDLLGLIKNPKVTIREILAKNNRIVEEDLPDQLNLFEGYYFGHSS